MSPTRGATLRRDNGLRASWDVSVHRNPMGGILLLEVNSARSVPASLAGFAGVVLPSGCDQAGLVCQYHSLNSIP